MRRHQQGQILELLQTISEAQAAGLYADCQQGALTVGEFIESIEGEGTGTVALLEQYCDEVFLVSNGERAGEELDKKLAMIEASVINELRPNKVEMLFITYKASMSDSIETIYKAANADPNCDAYWMPIPYCDRNSDGGPGKVYYEGAEYYADKGIVCTDWQKYDIEERRPDVIFTFAPYDGRNYVTSIHSSFYCERLRKLTDCLVYVPYFVWNDEPLPAQFCTSHGCFFAHLTIVQSEAVREKYIKMFKSVHGGDEKLLRNKFIALGSPKFDKVMFSKREDYEMPDGWLRLTHSKKAFLYNTTVVAITGGGEYNIKKIRSVLEMFKKRDDATLWWRPHPLSESTYKTMCPQFYDEYAQLVEDYKSEGWGIYDDTPDLHRAIIWTDAYIGDGSSVLTLYKATGKPCMAQEQDRYYYKYIRMSAVTDDALWCFTHKYNALFRMDKKTLQCEYVDAIQSEHIDEWALYLYAAACSGKIYFPPYRADEIAVYDTSSGSFSFIPLRADKPLLTMPEMEFHHGYKFIRAYSYGGYVYFVPCGYPAIIRLDSKTNKLEYIDDFINQLPGDYKTLPHDAVYMFGDATVSGSKIIIPTRRGNALLIFDMETCKSEVVKKVVSDLPDHAVASSVAFDGADYWILYPLIGRLDCFCCDTKKSKTIISEETGFITGHVAYASGYIWLSTPSTALKVDIRAKEATQAYELLCAASGSDEWGESFAVDIISDDTGVLKYVTSDGRYCECYVGDDKLINEVALLGEESIELLHREMMSQLPDKIMPDRGHTFELPFAGLDSFIDAVSADKFDSARGGGKDSKSASKPAGTVIYEAMRDLCLTGEMV